MPDQQFFIPSASVMVLRERNHNMEVLLLKKNAEITFGGSWVFPGGKVDTQDMLAARQNFEFNAERHAVVRECKEETGLNIDIAKLQTVSRWETPIIRPKRFTTVFFLYPDCQAEQTVAIDHGEIVDAKWISASEALYQHNNKECMLAGPAFVMLSQIAQKTNIDQAGHHFMQQGFRTYTPKIQLLKEGAISLYEGDECYKLLSTEQTSENSKLLDRIESAKLRHRLYMFKDKPWVYTNTKDH